MKCIFLSWISIFIALKVNAQYDSSVESTSRFHNKIDDITSKDQIEKLLRSINPYFSTFHVNDSLKFPNDGCKHVSDSLHCIPWFKTDFDNNGFTDLIVTG